MITETAAVTENKFWFENMSDEELLQAIYIRANVPPLVQNLAQRLREALDSNVQVLQQQGSMRGGYRRPY